MTEAAAELVAFLGHLHICCIDESDSAGRLLDVHLPHELGILGMLIPVLPLVATCLAVPAYR